MEQQAKERLTGGAILVVLLVLLVPELLTGPRPPPQPAAAQPDQAPMRSYTMDLGESARANSAPVAASTTVPAGGESAALAPAPGASAPSAKAPGVASALPSSPPGQPQTRAVPPAGERATAPRARSAKPPAAAGAAGTVWTVQLGTFTSRENAARLASRLKSRGFGATLSEATRNGHKLYRVRVGAEREHAAAQRLLGRLKAAGEQGAEIVSR